MQNLFIVLQIHTFLNFYINLLKSVDLQEEKKQKKRVVRAIKKISNKDCYGHNINKHDISNVILKNEYSIFHDFPIFKEPRIHTDKSIDNKRNYRYVDRVLLDNKYFPVFSKSRLNGYQKKHQKKINHYQNIP